MTFKTTAGTINSACFLFGDLSNSRGVLNEKN